MRGQGLTRADSCSLQVASKDHCPAVARVRTGKAVPGQDGHGPMTAWTP
jgi:hypothetical protein